MQSKVEITSKAKKDLRNLPREIQESFAVWVEAVEENGLAIANKSPGYNAEHLTGQRKGQRSIRLNKAYRVIFEVVNDKVQIVKVIEINKHKY